MRTITVKVTQEHIDKGVRLECGACPLALALHGAGFPDAVVVVNYWRARFGGPGLGIGRGAERFRADFDNGLPVRPQTFRLQAPEAGGAGANKETT